MWLVYSKIVNKNEEHKLDCGTTLRSAKDQGQKMEIITELKKEEIRTIETLTEPQVCTMHNCSTKLARDFVKHHRELTLLGVSNSNSKFSPIPPIT